VGTKTEEEIESDIEWELKAEAAGHGLSPADWWDQELENVDDPALTGAFDTLVGSGARARPADRVAAGSQGSEHESMNIVIPNVLSTERDALIRQGIYDFTHLNSIVSATPAYLIDGFFHERSLNVLVGSSGLGKTALAAMIGMRIAANVRVFGREVRQGSVLYCDSETPQLVFRDMLSALARHAGLPEPPHNFHVFSPNWQESSGVAYGSAVFGAVRRLRPRLVVVDPLRIFWPEVEKKSEVAAGLVQQTRQLSKDVGCSWLVMHHRRKQGQFCTASLEHDPFGWFEEAAGSHAIVNHSDTRLGIEPAGKKADLVIAGFARSLGKLPPIYISREHDAEGAPLGYRALTGVDCLPENYKAAYEQLPDIFRFGDAQKKLGGNSSSNTASFIEQCIHALVLRKDGKHYRKMME
jgi:AAA domain